MLKEQIFMFDYYLRSIKCSLLGKRIQSLIKMIKNESDDKVSVTQSESENSSDNKQAKEEEEIEIVKPK